MNEELIKRTMDHIQESIWQDVLDGKASFFWVNVNEFKNNKWNQ